MEKKIMCLKKFKVDLAYYFSEVLEKPIAKPLWVYISLSHACTYECQMCGVVKILKDYELPKETVMKAFDEISGWGWDLTIVITGGEAFLRKDIFELIDYGAKRGLKIEVVSNGSLIDQPMAERIIGSGLNNIAISLDGATEKTHDFIRQKGAFNKALNAISHLAAEKLKQGHGPQISVWTTIMKENVGELFDIIGLIKDLGVECLVYHPVIVSQDDMQNTSSNARFWIKGDDLVCLERQIERISKYQKNNGLVVFLHDPYLWLGHFKGELTRHVWKCNPFVFTNIGPDGELRSCGSAFGNIKTMSLEECLNTKEAFKARKIMKHCQKPCLQTCWANPDSDSLSGIADSLIEEINKNSFDENEKSALLKEALEALESYEVILKEKNAKS